MGRYSLAEYLRIEDESPTKHEYVDGEIIAMAGGTPEHAALSAAIGWALNAQLHDEYRAYSSDLRIWIEAANLGTYADAAVVCDPVEHLPSSPTFVTNPVLVVEVLSASTEDYDREDKRVAYQQLSSLQAYVLVAQDRRRVELWSRAGGDWQHTAYEAGEVARVPALDLALDVDAIYARAGVA
ncbi:MAG TPA: Uma2 family endonuclease [Kofleriaceae bacterium]|jgi:Uma2 family endonuclease